MNNIIVAFILTILAGLSTLIGTLFIFYKGDIKKLTKYSLAFASGVMASISLIDLIPEAINLIIKNNSKNNTFLLTLIFIAIGLILSYIIDALIPENKNVKNKKLYKLGIFSMLAIIMHNIPEGIATFLSSSSNLSLGISLAIAIALHNIPEGISISVPVYSATGSKKRAFIYTLISALAEPLGGVIAYLFLAPIITDNIMGYTLAIIAGIMLHISLLKLLPAAIKYREKKKILTFFIIGILFMIIGKHLI